MTEEAKAVPTQKRKISPSQIGLVVGGILSLVLVIGLIILLFIQFGPKKEIEPDWSNYNPPINPYPDSNLISGNTNTSQNFKQVWKIYASKDDLSKIKQFYTDQFLGLGYKLDETNSSTFPVSYYREENTKCYYVRYGLDVVSLDDSRIELPEVKLQDLKTRYSGQTLYLFLQFDSIIRAPTC